MNMIWRIGTDKYMGLKWYRQMLFENRVQQRLSQYLVTKDSLNLNGDNSLEGLVIDWHLAEYDYSMDLPIGDYQPTYAYAA